MIVNNYTTFREVFATAATHDVTGYRTWPSAKVGLAGFTGDIAVAKPIQNFPRNATCNNVTPDNVYGTDEYDWYLSQRTDNPAKQYLAISPVTVGAITFSGTVAISLTDLAVSTLGLADATSNVSIDNLVFLLKHVDLYVRRRSDSAIQHVQLLEATLSNY